ncbi:MAG TPA: hypothetical protein VG013_16795, partial [Gemmataceae bacterium]|nr:hypothetical protein [Gemmataceae bacterium]
YLLTGAGYAAYLAVVGEPVSAENFVVEFNDVAEIWFERNILLNDTIWPRRAHLELVDFPGDELKVGRDAPPPALRVRALKWVVADKDRTRAPEGWRALLWSDLTPSFIGADVPQLPSRWKPKDPERGLTVDEVDLRHDKRDERARLSADLVLALDATFRQLDDLAASSRMKRRLRKLKIPDEVKVILDGRTTHSEQGLPKQADNEYAGTLTDLKESVRFIVRGEDYETLPKKITIVPPPELVQLAMDADEPAYLFHRIPRQGTAADLRGLKQQFRDVGISLTGEKSSVEVPAGTELVLKAKTDKAIQDGGVHFADRPGFPAVKATIEQPDDHTFVTQLGKVTQAIDMVFEFTDTDKVSNQRHVIVKPVPDMRPEVNVQLDVLRKTNQGYMCTASALVPFSGRVHDDHGLSDLQFVYTVTLLESDTKSQQRTALAAEVVAQGAGGWAQKLAAMALYHSMSRSAAAADAKSPPKMVRLEGFDRSLQERDFDALSKTGLLEKLKPLAADASQQDQDYLDQPAVDRRLIKEYLLDTADSFDIIKLGLKSTPVQPHYRIQLTVVATDNNVETGPRSGENQEKFTLLVVSDEELLAEISREEEALHYKLKETVDKLSDARTKLDELAQLMPTLKPNEFSAQVTRTEELTETLTKGSDVAREVLTDYRRILKELQANQDRETKSGLIDKMITKVNDRIVDQLDTAIGVDFVHADESVRGLGKSLAAKDADIKPATKAQEAITALINRLNDVLDAMSEVTTINKLIEKLVQIQKAEDKEKERLDEMYRKAIDIALGGGLGEPETPKKDK